MFQGIKRNKKNTKLALLVFLFSLSPIFAQSPDFPISSGPDGELSEEYLESLPLGIRKDLLEKMQAQKDAEKPLYRRASTMLDKIEREESKTGIFGEDIFDMMQSTFMPINEPNLDSDYILDFGDVIELQMVGQKDSVQSFDIKRDGSINIPEIGKVFLSGLSLNEASSIIKLKIENAFIGTNVFVSLTNIRDIQVLISGNAYNPGIYTLNGNSNILHALTMAGGVSANGSYRDIKLYREDKIIGELDLYDLLVIGRNKKSLRLRSGDIIMVGSRQIIANVSNGVNRPGLYELREGETIDKLITFANGFNSNADLSSIQIQRVDKGEVIVLEGSLDKLTDVVAKDKDSLLITEFKYSTVKIVGAVKNPGTFVITSKETIKDVILRAGGYDDSAYPFGGFLKNKKSIELNEAAKDRLYNKFLNQIIEGRLAQQADTVIPLVLEELRNAEVSGRVIAEFDLGVLNNEPDKDTLLEDGDEIMIPRVTQQVYVYGEVNNQGATRYSPNKTIDYYIKSNGGTSGSADKENIFIVHPNGVTQSIQQKSNKLSFRNSEISGIPVYPGSIIYIPKEIEATSIESAAIWAPIISSLALSLTSLSVLESR